MRLSLIAAALIPVLAACGWGSQESPPKQPVPTVVVDIPTTTIPDYSAVYCEGWRDGQDYGLAQLQLDAAIPIDCPTDLVPTLASESDAYCLGLVDGFTDYASQVWGPPPPGYLTRAAGLCVASGTVFLGGSGGTIDNPYFRASLGPAGPAGPSVPGP